MTHYALILFYVAIAAGVVFMAGYDYCARKHKDALEELERWRIGQLGGQNWLCESREAFDALELLRDIAKGRAANDWEPMRDMIRHRNGK